jgi:hypothetical protein
MAMNHVSSNPAGAVDAPIALLFHPVARGGRATDQRCWTT